MFTYLLIQGTPDQKIIFTTQPNSGYTEVGRTEPQELGARLVDGPSPLAGRLQLFHEGKWRSVCTNSRKYVFHCINSTNANILIFSSVGRYQTTRRHVVKWAIRVDASGTGWNEYQTLTPA